MKHLIIREKWHDIFKDNGDGTVIDNMTGVIWLKNANCFGARDWYTAMDIACGLASGECGLTDGSQVGDWRLPTVREMRSLGCDRFPTLPDSILSCPMFTEIQPDYYWSSEIYVKDLVSCVRMGPGGASVSKKTYLVYVWPIRC